jgi:hypothetical protein
MDEKIWVNNEKKDAVVLL